MYKYKNISDMPLLVHGVGTVEAGAEVVTDAVIENPNFEALGEVSEQPTQPQEQLQPLPQQEQTSEVL